MSRSSHLRLRYGITEEQYEDMLNKQNHRCYICLRHKDEFKTRLAVDHNHKTLEIRGALCNYCNHRLVGRHTDADLVQRIADYLRQGTGWFVPEKKKKNTSKRNAVPSVGGVRRSPRRK